MKWELISEVDPKRDYLEFAEFGELKSRWAFFSWMRRGRKVASELKNAKGLIGFRGKVDFWSKKGIMVAVFEDEKTLMQFAHTGQHAQCMKKSKSDIKGEFKRGTWGISGSAIPPKIEDAINTVQHKK